MRRLRAFTLIEVAVAMALMVVVVGAAMLMLQATLVSGRKARVHSELMRDATFSSQLLNSDLRQAGLGVPHSFNAQCGKVGFNIRHDCAISGTGTTPCAFSYGLDEFGNPPGSSSFGSNFYSSVILANATQVGIVGDLPRVDGQYSAYGPLHNRATGGIPGTDDAISAAQLMWHNENNGSCAPGNGCSTANTSIFFGGEATQVCTTTGVDNDRTCPWGMRRVLPAERIQIVAGDGGWATSALASPLNLVSMNLPPPAPGGTTHLAIKVNPQFDAAVSTATATNNDTVWKNQKQGDGPGGFNGQGWVTTLDRVFYFFDAASKTLNRVQCSGDPDPNNPKWPDRTVTSIAGGPAAFVTNVTVTPTPPGAPMAAGDVVPNVCFGPDVVARNVQSVTFSYFDGNNAAIAAPLAGEALPTAASCPPGVGPPALDNTVAGKNRVRRIDYVITFQKNAAETGTTAQLVTHVVRGSVRLLNLQNI